MSLLLGLSTQPLTPHQPLQSPQSLQPLQPGGDFLSISPECSSFLQFTCPIPQLEFTQ